MHVRPNIDESRVARGSCQAEGRIHQRELLFCRADIEPLLHRDSLQVVGQWVLRGNDRQSFRQFPTGTRAPKTEQAIQVFAVLDQLDFDTSELEACLLIHPELVHPHPLAHVARVELSLRQIGRRLTRVGEPPHQLDHFDV